MIYIQEIDRYDKIKEHLAHSLGNSKKIVTILKEATLSDSIDLLAYDPAKKLFYDKIKKNTIPLKFLEENNSMTAKAYIFKTPYHSSHIRYDSNYNTSIDNPFKLSLSTQVIVPVINENRVIGIIRFSKSQYTFEQHILEFLRELEGSFSDIFSVEMDKIAEKFNSTFFAITKEEVYEIIDRLKDKTNLLNKNTENPEIKKLIHRIEDDIESISDYIEVDANHLPLYYQEEEPKESSNINILIADDVQMNVKILHAMLKKNPLLNLTFAYDGVETLNKIKQAYRDKNKIDILFLDHYMPGKLGLEIAQTIRRYEQMTKATSRLIIISITNDPTAIEKYQTLFDYHISKPFIRTDITNVMESIQDLKQKG